MDVENNLESLKKQLKSAEIAYYKILGAVETLEAIQNQPDIESQDNKTK
tara:strand:+ start:186 stop:332 length:147 start_codon:yes stop_codon:yes gene_type:complete